MKRSRTRGALLFIVLLVLGFVALVAGLSLVVGDEDDSGLADLFSLGKKIGVVKVEGTIMSSQPILKELRKFSKKSSVKAILIRIDSPGGAVAPAQEIYREIGKIKKKKPVIASMETIGASAAYLIASNSDRIVCSRGTITGSIGVIMMLPEIHEAIKRMGIGVNVITAGKFKDMGSAVRPLREDERKYLKAFAKEVHEQFISAVATGRKGKIEREKLNSVADGRFFTGEKAKELGLVDSLGNFYDAVKIAGTLGGIEGDPKLVYPEKEWDSYLDTFFESAASAVARAVSRASLGGLTPSFR